MTETQKKENKNYILNNLDKYIIDGHNNFINCELELGGDKYYIENFQVENYEEVKEKVIESLLKDKSRWDKVFSKKIVAEVAKAILQEKED